VGHARNVIRHRGDLFQALELGLKVMALPEIGKGRQEPFSTVRVVEGTAIDQDGDVCTIAAPDLQLTLAPALRGGPHPPGFGKVARLIGKEVHPMRAGKTAGGGAEEMFQGVVGEYYLPATIYDGHALVQILGDLMQ
jgi:hypothetical protein